MKSYTDLPKIAVDRVLYFFEHYKDLRAGKWVKVVRWGDDNEARKLIVEAIERYNADKAKA